MKIYSIKEFQRNFPAVLKTAPLLISKRGIVIAELRKYEQYKIKGKSKNIDNTL